MNIIDRPKALVEPVDKEFVVILVNPHGTRDYYVATGVDERQKIVPYVTDKLERAKRFGLESSAKSVAGDMQAFLNGQYANLVKWH